MLINKPNRKRPELFGFAQKRGFGQVTGSASASPYRKFGFTMAEILIAMTILGIIALMTIPQILGNTGGRSNKLMMQKTYAVLSQNLKMAYAKLEYDTSEVDRITSFTESGTGAIPVDEQKSIENILLKTLDLEKLDGTTHPFLSTTMWELSTNDTSGESILKKVNHSGATISVGSDSDAKDKGAIFKSRDGSYIIFPDKNDIPTLGCTKKSPCLAYIDVNGPDAPNALMSCATAANTAYWNQINERFEIENAPANPSDPPTYSEAGACEIDVMDVTDTYAVLIYGGTIVPASNAAKAALLNRD